MNYYLDTNICLCFLKGICSTFGQKLELINPSNIKIPSIVKAEILYYAKISEKKIDNLIKVKKFLEPFEIVEFGGGAPGFLSSLRAEMDKKGKCMSANDLIIASIVFTCGGVLVTDKVKEFSQVNGLIIENWA
ncbi:MAG: type II toxin-antitoxin system VapC family toxin [Candidatus Delongbacteria bacterium]|nr:type II toxin-antitoxin system VapC family toxin [Candidatus Delongbacteria bacterium]